MKALALAIPLFVCAPAQTDGSGPPQVDQDAVRAYREGDYATATSLWKQALEEVELPGERARIAYDLGNAAFREGRKLDAVGWYTASLRLVPRDADAWSNLELARTEAGLDPADRGDLVSTIARLLGSMTPAEAEWVVLGALALLLLCLSCEALRGGVLWRRASIAAAVVVALSLGPWLWSLERASRQPVMIVASDGAAARSEPRGDAKQIERIAVGAEVERLDRLPGWIKVRTGEGNEVWVRERAVFDLVL